MFIPRCTIQIGELVFKQVTDVRIEKSVDQVADTAVIKLPTKFTLRGSGEQLETTTAILPGQKVSIRLAYEGVIDTEEFSGYVKAVKPNTPVAIECEDAVYLLRRKSLNKNFTNTTLKEVMEYIVEGTDVKLSGKLPDVKLNKFLLKSTNGAQALVKIKEEYGLSCFIDDDGNLFAGLRQTEGLGQEVEYRLDGDIIEHDLEYKTADQVSIKLKAIAWQSDNTKLEVTVGDEDGEQRTWQTYGVDSKAKLKELATGKLSSMKYDGYDGTITALLWPYANRGMTANISDGNYPERAGKYYIPRVVITLRLSGARRVVTLGRKVA